MAGQTFRTRDIVGIIVGLLLPVIGVIVAVMMFRKGRTRPGMAVLIASAIGVLVNLMLLAS